MASVRNQEWSLIPQGIGGAYTHEQAILGVLMDIRSELRRLNNVMQCNNTRDIPFKLDKIVTNTTKAKRKRKASAR